MVVSVFGIQKDLGQVITLFLCRFGCFEYRIGFGYSVFFYFYGSSYDVFCFDQGFLNIVTYQNCLISFEGIQSLKLYFLRLWFCFWGGGQRCVFVMVIFIYLDEFEAQIVWKLAGESSGGFFALSFGRVEVGVYFLGLDRQFFVFGFISCWLFGFEEDEFRFLFKMTKVIFILEGQ